MPRRIQHRRGLHQNLPTTGMLAGELLITTDRRNLHIAADETTRFTPTPAIDMLQNMGAISGAADFLLIHDADATGQKEKKILFDDFKTALNIPPGSSDEKVAIIAGGTAGYLWGTDGSDGVIRMGAGLSWTKDTSNSYVTIEVDIIDCGTF